MKIVLKIVLVSFITTLFRIIGQILISESGTSQTTLLPSFFVENGTLPLGGAICIFYLFSHCNNVFVDS